MKLVKRFFSDRNNYVSVNNSFSLDAWNNSGYKKYYLHLSKIDEVIFNNYTELHDIHIFEYQFEENF